MNKRLDSGANSGLQTARRGQGEADRAGRFAARGSAANQSGHPGSFIHETIRSTRI